MAKYTHEKLAAMEAADEWKGAGTYFCTTPDDFDLGGEHCETVEELALYLLPQFEKYGDDVYASLLQLDEEPPTPKALPSIRTGIYAYITRGQCNAIYKAFKQGQLTPPKDCRGKVKRPGFVYRYEGETTGHYPHMVANTARRVEENNRAFLLNCQVAAIKTVAACIFEGRLEEAQMVLDGQHEGFNWDWLPSGVEPAKMWRVV